MKLPDPSRTFEDQPEDVLLAMCIFGEARGQASTAKVGVGNVVRNRVLHRTNPYGRGWRGVILKRRQFSCFLPNDPNCAKLLRPLEHERPEVWAACWEVAEKIYQGLEADNTGGATHYFDDSLKDRPPRWAKLYVPTVKIGRLNFFRAPDPAPGSSRQTSGKPDDQPGTV